MGALGWFSRFKGWGHRASAARARRDSQDHVLPSRCRLRHLFTRSLLRFHGTPAPWGRLLLLRESVPTGLAGHSASILFWLASHGLGGDHLAVQRPSSRGIVLGVRKIVCVSDRDTHRFDEEKKHI